VLSQISPHTVEEFTLLPLLRTYSSSMAKRGRHSNSRVVLSDKESATTGPPKSVNAVVTQPLSDSELEVLLASQKRARITEDQIVTKSEC